MKRYCMFILSCCFVLAITNVAMSQLYFEDNFDNPIKSEDKWVPLWGNWEFKEKEYHQLSNDSNCMSVIADGFWDEEWNDYTYELSGTKTGGAEGFLIMFRCQGLMQAREKALAEHPPRMKGLPQLQYWWNLGGWGNSVSRMEVWIAGAHKLEAESQHTIDTNKLYNIKIVNTPENYTLYIDDEKVEEVADDTQDGAGRVGLATWSTTAIFDDVLVYGPNGPLPVDPKGKVTTAWGFLKAGR